MERPISSGLRLTFALSALAAFVPAVLSVFAPKLVADLSGLPGVDLPVYQQAGALTLGYAVASFLCLRATTWDEVRIPVVFNLAFALPTVLGGSYYYVVFKGVVGPYLLATVALAIFFTLAYAYYLWTYAKQGGKII